MKRLRMLVLLGAIAVALPLGLTTAKAAGTSGTTDTTSVTIDSTADFEFAGTQLDVGLRVRCYGGSGFVDVTVEQSPPETPVGAAGTGAAPVVCDGKTRPVGVTIEGALYDEGKGQGHRNLDAAVGYTHGREVDQHRGRVAPSTTAATEGPPANRRAFRHGAVAGRAPATALDPMLVLAARGAREVGLCLGPDLRPDLPAQRAAVGVAGIEVDATVPA